MLSRPSDVTEDGEIDGIVGLATAVASSSHGTSILKSDERPFLAMPKSFSLPLLPQEDGNASVSLRQSKSDSGLRESTMQGLMRSIRPSQATASTATSDDLPTTSLENISPPIIPTFHIREATNDRILLPTVDKSVVQPKAMSSEDSLHLQKMAISQQLRSMSQLSDVAEDELHSASTDPWIFHRRERSDVGGISRSGRHRRHPSSSGMDSTTVPSAWGRVRSPMPDAASSIYSRPTSAGGSGVNHNGDTPDQELHVPTVDLHALFSDWPLKTLASVKSNGTMSEDTQRRAGGSERQNKPLPPTPSDSRKDSGSASFVTAANDAEPASIRWLSPPQRPGSTRSDDASILTKTSKHSKFLERFSPPKKSVKKRRSIFKFLRPGSRKQQDRSISTPTLTAPSPKIPASYDGQSEDPALLTIQYELDERPTHTRRAASMNNLLAAPNTDGPSQPQIARSLLERRPTLADYERHLSVIGDDRRRPSAINLERAQEVQADDHRESVGIRRRISRARPLKDDASPLMAQALEKHQQEKALFRSASKQRESLNSSVRTAPIFTSSPFGSLAPMPDDASELFLDAVDKGKAPATIQRSRSSTYLLPPGPSHGALGQASNVPQSASLRSNAGRALGSDLPLTKKRIGTSLESWSRYPSHTRAERCGSAGRPDDVITRDFAVDINHSEIQETDETEATSPNSKRTERSKRSKRSLPKSRSMTFSSIVRYYANLFSSSSVGQNRRTSVAIGGRLEYPELELLPPQLAAEPLAQSSNRHSGALHHFKEHAKEDADKIKHFVEEEEMKVEDYIREEEDKFETFVRREEDKLEGFVKKEEGKLKEYVRTEEDKFKQHWHHQPGGHGRESPFREISLFEVPRGRSQEAKARRDTLSIAPNDDIEEESPIVVGDSASGAGLRFDGASITSTLDERKPSSKAELWSEVYRECLPRPSLAAQDEVNQPVTPGVSMPPRELRPAKARSPEQTGSTATVRRFPSVTVIDDRKGHFRSISLISVKTGSSGGYDQTNTHELLELVQARERRKRDKVAKGVEAHRLSSLRAVS